VDIVKAANKLALQNKCQITLTSDPLKAVSNADVVYTDVWLSMGIPESEREARLAAFMPYQVNKHLMSAAAPHAIFMHCLPCHRNEEVTASVIDGSQSVIFDQAENRLHTAKAMLFFLLKARG
jgi:ornithine carbamoyltransferase